MRHLSIHNFGPLKDVELDIKDYGIFIGPQASGKSTITKLIYYFLSLKEDIKQYIIEVIANGKRINPHNGEINIMKKHRAKFVQLFGTTKHMNDFDILFVYLNPIICRGFLLFVSIYPMCWRNDNAIILV